MLHARKFVIHIVSECMMWISVFCDRVLFCVGKFVKTGTWLCDGREN